VFNSLHHSLAELDACADDYNKSRPHQSLGMKTPLEAFATSQVAPVPCGVTLSQWHRIVQGICEWVTRKASSAGVVTVSWRQISVGKHCGGRKGDIHFTGEVLQIWDGSELPKTVLKADKDREVQVKKAFTMPQKKS
jgi:hypothetical protein